MLALLAGCLLPSSALAAPYTGVEYVRDLGEDSSDYNDSDYDGIVDTSEKDGALFYLDCAHLGATAGLSLWRSDGTRQGTGRVRALAPVDGRGRYFCPGGCGHMVSSGGTLYIVVGGLGTSDVWKSDGTPAGTQLVASIAEGQDGGVEDVTAAGPGIYSTLGDGEHGRELWTSDGTVAGTHMVEDILPGELGADPSGLVAGGDGYVYFD